MRREKKTRIYLWRVTTTNDFPLSRLCLCFLHLWARFIRVGWRAPCSVCVGVGGWCGRILRNCFRSTAKCPKMAGWIHQQRPVFFLLLLFCFRVFTHFRTFLNCKFIVVLWHRICLVPVPVQSSTLVSTEWIKSLIFFFKLTSMRQSGVSKCAPQSVTLERKTEKNK